MNMQILQKLQQKWCWFSVGADIWIYQ